jgi:hypothetical protein
VLRKHGWGPPRLDEETETMRVARAATALTACALVGTLLMSTAGGAAPGSRGTSGSSPPTPEGGPAQSVGAEERQAAEPRPLLELVSGGGSGRLYTLDHAEASAAVSDHGMQLQPGRVGYVPATGVEGTRPMFRLKPRPDATAWLFTTSSRR